MNVTQAAYQVERDLASPLAVWPEYSPATIPLVIFDDDDFRFYNHPAPPQRRPAHMMGATAAEIDGVWTALVPVTTCQDETDLIPLVYHECFHAFQHSGAFRFDEQFDFFRSLAFYPELDATYRALCLAEIEVLESPGLQPGQKATLLAGLAERRQAILAARADLPAFVQHLERLEGTAFYVEQQVRAQRFGVPAEMFSAHYGGVVPGKYGWTRHHAVGAAICRLLDGTYDNWQGQVAGGASLSALLIDRFGQQRVDLACLDLAAIVAREQQSASQIRAGLEAQIAQLEQDGAIRIQWPEGASVVQMLSPTAAVSLGDGRLLHGSFLTIQLPNGTIQLQGGRILQDYNRREVMFPAVPVDHTADRLQVDTDTAQIALSGVGRIGENRFRLAQKTRG